MEECSPELLNDDVEVAEMELSVLVRSFVKDNVVDDEREKVTVCDFDNDGGSAESVCDRDSVNEGGLESVNDDDHVSVEDGVGVGGGVRVNVTSTEGDGLVAHEMVYDGLTDRLSVGMFVSDMLMEHDIDMLEERETVNVNVGAMVAVIEPSADEVSVPLEEGVAVTKVLLASFVIDGENVAVNSLVQDPRDKDGVLESDKVALRVSVGASADMLKVSVKELDCELLTVRVAEAAVENVKRVFEKVTEAETDLETSVVSDGEGECVTDASSVSDRERVEVGEGFDQDRDGTNDEVNVGPSGVKVLLGVALTVSD